MSNKALIILSFALGLALGFLSIQSYLQIQSVYSLERSEDLLRRTYQLMVSDVECELPEELSYELDPDLVRCLEVCDENRPRPSTTPEIITANEALVTCRRECVDRE